MTSDVSKSSGGVDPSKGPTQEDLMVQQQNQNQWQAAAIQLLLPAVTSSMLSLMEKDLDLTAKLNESFLKANVASGHEEEEAASATEFSTIAGVSAGAFATGLTSSSLSRSSPELKDLQAKDASLRDELKGSMSGAKIGHTDAEMQGRSKEEIMADREAVGDKMDVLKQHRQMLVGVGQQAGSGAQSIIQASGQVSASTAQMASKINQSEAQMFQQLTSTIQQLFSSELDFITNIRQTPVYEAQSKIAG